MNCNNDMHSVTSMEDGFQSDPVVLLYSMPNPSELLLISSSNRRHLEFENKPNKNQTK